MRLHVERLARFAARIGVATALALAPLALTVVGTDAEAQPPKDGPGGPKDKGDKGGPPEQAKVKLGLNQNDPKAFQGYTLIAPLNSPKTYLIDMQGRVVKTWEHKTPALSASLLDNGHLLLLDLHDHQVRIV